MQDVLGEGNSGQQGAVVGERWDGNRQGQAEPPDRKRKRSAEPSIIVDIPMNGLERPFQFHIKKF